MKGKEKHKKNVSKARSGKIKKRMGIRGGAKSNMKTRDSPVSEWEGENNRNGQEGALVTEW